MNYFKKCPYPQVILPVIALLFILTISSCSQKINFQTSNVVPAAKGKVKIKKDKNNNYSITINIDNLAEAKRLEPPKKTYVVWIETSSGTKNIGQMTSKSGFLSSGLNASLNAVSSFKPTKVFITAENDGDIRYPGSQMVLSTGTF